MTTSSSVAPKASPFKKAISFGESARRGEKSISQALQIGSDVGDGLRGKPKIRRRIHQ